MNKLWMAAAALALLAGGASAETFTPVPGLGSTVLDFDTQSGNFSAWIVNDLSGINAVRATVQVHRLGTDPRWLPAFKINVYDTTGRHVSFGLMGKAGAPKLVVLLGQGDKDQDEQLDAFTDRLALDTPIEVAVEWAPDGTITVRAGSETKAAKLAGAAARLEFSGSTGEIEFNPLKIGKVTQ